MDVLPHNASRFSVEEGSKTNLSDLETLIVAVNSGPATGRIEWQRTPTYSR